MARADRPIHALAIPTPFAVGDVNAYLIEDDPLTLVDGGPNMATSLAHLEALLAGLGHRALIARSLDPAAPDHVARPKPLLAYGESLLTTRALDVDVVLGGHGAPVRDHRALIDRPLAVQEERAAERQDAGGVTRFAARTA